MNGQVGVQLLSLECFNAVLLLRLCSTILRLLDTGAALFDRLKTY